MATAVQRRRNTHTLHSAFAGQAGEFSFDTDAGMIHGHKGDGRPGGIPVGGGVVHAIGWGFRAGSNTYATANRAAWQALMNKFSTDGGGTLLFPEGDFYLNCSFTAGAINIPSNVAIRMSKYTRLLSFLNGDTGNGTMLRINRATNVHISGGELVGEPAAGYAYGLGIVGVDGFKSSNIVIENLVCRNWQTDGWYIEDGTNIRIRNVESYDNSRHGAAIVRGTNIQVLNSQFEGNTLAGLDLETEGTTDVTDVLFSGCRFKDNTDQGLYCQKGVGTGVPRRITVDNCDFDGNGANQVAVNNTYDLALTGVTRFRNGGSDSLALNQVVGARIGRLDIKEGGRGIYVLASRDVVVDGFEISDTTDNAIEIRDDSPTTYPTTRVEMKNGNISNCTAEFGAYLVKGNDCRFENIRVNKIGKHGIAVGAGFGNAIVNCHAYQCSMVADNTYSGIFDGGVATKLVGNVARLGDRGSTATCQAGSTVNNAILHAWESDQNDIYNGYKIEILSGTGAGQVRYITDYVGSTVTASVSPAWSTAPHSDSVYSIIPVGAEGISDDAAKSTAPNKQKYGIFSAGFKTFLHDNDTLNGGKTANLQNSSNSSDAADNRS